VPNCGGKRRGSAASRPPQRSISQRSELVYDVHEFGINIDHREVFLHWHGYSPELMIDGFVAANVIKNIRILNQISSAPILLHQISNGGDWNFGMAIYDALASSRAPVILLAHAHARSMSSIIPQAASKRVIMPHADFLIHLGTSDLAGNLASVISEAEWEKILTDRMLAIYADRCVRGPIFKRKKWSRERIKEWIRRRVEEKQEFYLSAKEAVDHGLMDAVLGDPGHESIEGLLATK